MKTILHISECYTDNSDIAVTTRTKVVSYEKLFGIADRLRSNAEELVCSSNPPSTEDCRIAQTMLGWAFELVPIHIATRLK